MKISPALTVPPELSTKDLVKCRAQNIRYHWVTDNEVEGTPIYLVTAMLPMKDTEDSPAPEWMVTDVCDFLLAQDERPNSEIKGLVEGPERDKVEEYVLSKLNT